MLLVEKIVSAFQFKKEYLILKETVNYFKIVYTSNEVSLPNSQEILDIKKKVPLRDKLKIYIECDEIEIARCSSKDDIEKFLYDFEESINDVDDVNYKITIDINKNIDDGNISVYNCRTFIKYLKELSLNQILFKINNIIKKFGAVYFRTDDIFYMNTKSIYFLQENDEICLDNNFRTNKILNRNQNCSYLNTSEYEFIAEDFILINKSNNSELNEIFFKLATIYSLIGICDVSIIKNEEITLIVNGYRRIDGKIIYSENFNTTMEEYIKIYNWIYNESNNDSCTDKIGISRNVITSSIVENKINSPYEGLFRSICSAHSIYLKENVKEYLDVKSKISEFNFELMQKMSELSKEIGKSLYNNLKVIASFYGTVFVMNILSDKKLDNIFTKDITNLSLVICGFSFIYMIITRFNIKKEIEIFENQYERMKHNYDEILNSEDRENIFKNDEYINQDKKIIKMKVRFYSIIWIVAIIIFLMLIYHLGYLYVCELFNSWIKLIIALYKSILPLFN